MEFSGMEAQMRLKNKDILHFPLENDIKFGDSEILNGLVFSDFFERLKIKSFVESWKRRFLISN